MKQVWLMCGLPGSGKSTWLKKNISSSIVISRDVVRFSMLSNEDEYFDKEPEVFTEFMRQVNDCLEKNDVVYIDATHICVRSRNKIKKALTVPYDELNAICMRTSVETCLQRNSAREGRAKVPDKAILDMSRRLQFPNKNEGFTQIINIVEE